jgi:hypothetical protein
MHFRSIADQYRADKHDDPLAGSTLTEVLAALGCTHRPSDRVVGKREVIDHQGCTVGHFCATEGWGYVRARLALAAASPGGGEKPA